MLLEQIKECMENHKNDTVALEALEAFLHACSEYVLRECRAGTIEQLIQKEVPATDISSLQSAYSIVQRYGFKLPADMPLAGAAGMLTHEIFVKRVR